MENEKWNRVIQEEAVKWRNQRRKEWVQGKIPLEDKWLIDKMDEMFPND